MEVAYTAELDFDSALVGDQHEHCLDAVAGDIKLMKTEMEETNNIRRYDSETRRVTKTTINVPSQVTAPIPNEFLVGLNGEVKRIIARLVRGSRQLDIVAIVGMPGLGKTTLASKVYNDPSVKFHFHIRAWCCVSRAYGKHSLLSQILCCIDDYGSSDQYLQMNEDDMAEKLRKLLKRNRYLITLDDVWDIDGWDLLKHSLPDDCNGSRILLTSRLQKLSSQIKLESKPHHLRPLTDNESCELLQKKLFAKEDSPPTLGKEVLQVARLCKGLPLAVVIVAGIFATTQQDCWEEVAKQLSSTIFADNEHFMDTIELSYNNLPNYLKPCFLYFGAFPQKCIPVRKLLWLWISEGFVQKTEGKSLEDVTDDYLMDLIGRSLVMPAKQRVLGGIKVCRIHDLVHEFCVAKAKEESFVQIVHGANNLSNFSGLRYTHRLSIFPATCRDHIMPLHHTKSLLSPSNLHCLLLFDETSSNLVVSKSLRVLDLGRNVPVGVEFLVHLRYLSFRWEHGEIPSAIGNLSRLQTFVVQGYRNFYLLPNTIWNIKTLRQLVVLPSCGSGFRFPIDNLEGSPKLKYLNTLSLAIDSSSQSLQKILTKLPNIRRLKCLEVGCIGSAGNILMLDYLSLLESLKIRGFVGYEFEFPLNLRKLTLSFNYQPWSKISAIGKLPHLEVLKLHQKSFVGEKWEMEEGEFENLRFLELSKLFIRRWEASSDNFCCLEKLVLHHCVWLEKVPSCLWKTLTLDMIEVNGCRKSVVNSVKQIQQKQMDMGNKDLRIIIAERKNQWWCTSSS